MMNNTNCPIFPIDAYFKPLQQMHVTTCKGNCNKIFGFGRANTSLSQMKILLAFLLLMLTIGKSHL